MDNDEHLEAELKQLRPAAPSRRLVENIASDLSIGSNRRTVASVAWPWAVALAAAAALVFLLPQFENHTVAPVASAVLAASPESAFKPVAAENVLVSAKDEGLVTLDDGTPARRERLHYVDTITWRNPRTNASLTWSLPREEVRVVPVAFQ